ncbi:MAG TPA: GNAT family N-acetyltransferase [Thermoleophilaceae bacterium]|jgi:ribosomal protein S18 acetylase RimI-like enzyme|nr:GNAT family N-acetyltransferase [Thermoleophilaceae bacterium]
MGTDAASRARAWVHENQAAICDVIEPWEHGTVIRATRYPDYWDYNLVRVEEEAELSAGELVRVADRALSGLPHRRVGFEVESAGWEAIRPDLEALGWKVSRLVWMRHDGPGPPAPGADIEQVAYDAVRHLRVEWFLEDFPDVDPKDFFEQEREISMVRNAQVFAAFEGGAPVGFSQLERGRGAAEVTSVFVLPDHRGRGLGTALTRAAIETGLDASDLWIVADDEGRPKEIYSRLGFRPEWKLLDCLRLPGRT